MIYAYLDMENINKTKGIEITLFKNNRNLFKVNALLIESFKSLFVVSCKFFFFLTNNWIT